MKRFFAAVLMVPVVALAVTEPPLPLWEEGARQEMLEEGWIAGDTLLLFGPLPKQEQEEKEEETPLNVEQPTEADLAEEEIDETEVAEEFLVQYFENKPTSYLVDPQNLMDTRQQKDLETFIEYHAKDSSIDMYIYVFGADQRIPSEVREEEVVERLYSVGKPAVIVYYYAGAPQRSAVYLSPVLTDAVSAAEQRRALESSVMKAFASAQPFEQLEAFLVQMSIRIYWMERMIEGTAAETMATIPGDERAPKPAAAELAAKRKIEIPAWMKLVGAAAVAACGGLLALWSLAMWWMSRRRFQLPEFEVEPRLGGSHAAGIGAVISFSSSAVPPARQRDQVPDYMRRM
ncbi:MAG: hypothetical protein ABJQ29_14945 [Luteolibacter sp.]